MKALARRAMPLALLGWFLVAGTGTCSISRSLGAEPVAEPTLCPPTQAAIDPSAETPSAEAHATKELVRNELVTKPNTAFFWSGRTGGVYAEKVAPEMAIAMGGITIDQLMKAKGLKEPNWNPNDPESIKKWKALSVDFSRGASGHVRVVLGNDLRPGNTWEAVELPALKANPRVTKITAIDPATKKERVLFERR
ncbi:hypothetical protein Pan216_16370 [Planctomycetes bacterium Pan216]|uniref:Uncharacterized protein n=1 Tax=Kolteria novifilia TaxID=2527975 RepID=A0A518B1C6_9BACT|nr:hypothetical protein Pan216_16370 [Planctomycetes bacterium Pan216]